MEKTLEKLQSGFEEQFSRKMTEREIRVMVLTAQQIKKLYHKQRVKYPK